MIIDKRKIPRTTPLSEADGTAWKLCLTEYIPTNVRIRSKMTVLQYRYAFQNLRDFIGHEPALADLTDANVAGMMGVLLDAELAAKTVNERAGRIRCFWTWCAKQKLVEKWPTVQNVKEPKRTPRAWSREDLAAIIDECDVTGGRVAGIPARLWWKALHLVLFDTGARIGETLALRWEWVNVKTGYVDIPSEVRKGNERDMTYQLHAETLALLESIREPKRALVFPWDRTETILYHRYKKILVRAGLPDNSKCMFHKMRRSVASHLQAGGHNASQVLGHSSANITRESYLDPHIVGMVSPSAVLFRIGSQQREVEPAQIVNRAMPVAPPREPALLAEEWL